MEAYRISVPVMCANLTEENREKTLAQLRRAKASRVFLAVSAFHTDSAVRRRVLEDLKEKIDFFHRHGFEVGVWTWSSMVLDENGFQHKVNSEGKAHPTWICHADRDFQRLVCRFAEEVARLAPELLMFDDDFKYSRDPMGLHGCFCPWHQRLCKEEFGEEAELSELARQALEDPASDLGRRWFSVMGKGLESYAEAVRAAVDRVNPSLRIGFCANLSSYGAEGTDAIRLSRLFAGGTKPFLRTIGAPYWDWYEDYPMKLSEVLELERHQAKLLEDEGIEIMSEGDVFPRPRTAACAAHLELFDSLLAANGGHDGILKYLLDYYSPADYETGYVEAHVKNLPLTEELRRHFAEKKAVGIRIFSDPRLFRESRLAYAFGSDPYDYRHHLLSLQAGRVLSRLSLPATYEKEGIATAAFGEAARYLTKEDRRGGVITDLAGALALQAEGIDAGLAACGEGISPVGEYFAPDAGNPILDKKGYYAVSVRDSAEILSHFVLRHPFYSGELSSMERFPAAYRYENPSGERYLVLCFVAALADRGFCSYHKAEQIRRALPWLCGKELPACCPNNPDLYLLCKREGDCLCVGLWNLSSDPVFEPRLFLSEAYTQAEYLGCTGGLHKNEVTLSPLSAHSFCAVVLKK